MHYYNSPAFTASGGNAVLPPYFDSALKRAGGDDIQMCDIAV